MSVFENGPVKMSKGVFRIHTAEMARRVQEIIHTRLGNVGTAVGIQVGEDCVTLTGRAPSFYAKQLATHAAFSVIDEAADDPRAVELHNDIEVD